MRLISKHTDGSVAITEVMPSHITDLATGQVFKILGHRQVGETKELYGENFFLPFTGLIGDLEEDTFLGFKVSFYSGDEIFGKWPRNVPVSYRQLAPSELIEDRYFRNAWEDNGKLSVNMPKAREIHKNHMRGARAPLLAQLDEAYLRADETQDAWGRADVVSQKQALRDVTADPAIEAAKTPDALKAVWPAILGEP